MLRAWIHLLNCFPMKNNVTQQTKPRSSSPLPHSNRGRLSGTSPPIHLATVVSTDLSPSAGRSGGGRAGDPRLSVVYSVGSVGFAAGGALEVVVAPVLCLLQVRDPFGGGARRSSAVRRLLPHRSRIGGSGRCGLPRPDPVRRIWVEKILKTTTAWCDAAEPMDQGVTPPGAVSLELPGGLGDASSILGVWTSRGSGAFLSRPGRRRCWSSGGLPCNFLCFLGFSVRSVHL